MQASQTLLVTGYDKNGTSIVLEESKPELHVVNDARGKPLYRAVNAWASESFPNDNQDDTNYGPNLTAMWQKGGSAVRILDFAPNSEIALHRCKCLDIGVLISGEVWATLDSKVEKKMTAGDVIVKRGTMSGWVNKTDKWVRIVFFIVDSKPIEIDGRVLEDAGLEDIGK